MVQVLYLNTLTSKCCFCNCISQLNKLLCLYLSFFLSKCPRQVLQLRFCHHQHEQFKEPHEEAPSGAPGRAAAGAVQVRHFKHAPTAGSDDNNDRCTSEVRRKSCVCPEEAAGCVTNTCSNRITSKLQSVVSTSVEAKFTETKTAVCRWVKTVQSIKHKIYAASCVLNLVWIRLKCVIAHVQPFQPLFFKYVSRMRLIS